MCVCNVTQASDTWKWPPLRDHEEPFRWLGYNMYGTYGGNTTAHALEHIENWGRESKMMHTDNTCGISFAIGIHGIKGYQLQSPAGHASEEWKETTNHMWDSAGGSRSYRCAHRISSSLRGVHFLLFEAVITTSSPRFA
jgi:hypothetical protein